MNGNIKKSMEEIYSLIPSYIKCKHCHQCCGPIIWSEPEENLIRDYMYKNKIKHILWTKEEFKKNKMRCPYLINDRCIIYPVRPIVCRLQGNIPELNCKSSKNDKLISENEMENIKRKILNLIKQTKGMNKFYSTLKF